MKQSASWFLYHSTQSLSLKIFSDDYNQETRDPQSHRLQPIWTRPSSGGQQRPCPHSQALAQPEEEEQRGPDCPQWRREDIVEGAGGEEAGAGSQPGNDDDDDDDDDDDVIIGNAASI